MTCKEAKARMMGLLYDDMDEGEGELLASHLSACASCAAELEALRKTTHLLRAWKDEDPQLRMQFVMEGKRRPGRWPRLAWWPRWAGVGLGVAAAAMLLMALFNLEISYRDGDFGLRMGLLPRPIAETTGTAPDSAAAARYVTPEMLARVQEENLRLMQELIEASEARQVEFVSSALSQFAAEVEAQRQRDLRLVDRGLEAMHFSTERQFQETQEILGSLIQLARTGYTQPENRQR